MPGPPKYGHNNGPCTACTLYLGDIGPLFWALLEVQVDIDSDMAVPVEIRASSKGSSRTPSQGI